MLLSEAIMLGSTMGAQIFGRMTGSVVYGNPHASCALGAAALASGHWQDGNVLDGWMHRIEWPWLAIGTPTCPICPNTSASPMHLITHLNDDHRWSREMIADYVATIEPKESQVQTEKEEEVLCELAKL